MRTVRAGAERRADVLQVMFDERTTILGDERVDGIRRLEICQVRPRTEDM